jgi:hypothetical protein
MDFGSLSHTTKKQKTNLKPSNTSLPDVIQDLSSKKFSFVSSKSQANGGRTFHPSVNQM